MLKMALATKKYITERKQAEDKIRRAEQEKADILDSMNELVIFQDLEHRMIWVNKVAAESVNLPLDQLVGKHCYEVWPQRDTPCVGCPVAKARQSGKAEETEIATPDGRVWFIRGYPMRDANGSITGLLEVTLDITDRKQAEEQLQESQKYSTSLLANSPNPISVINPDTSIRYVNPAFEKLTGYSAAELIGRKAPFPYWTEETLQEAFRSFKKAMRHGDKRAEKLFQKKNGERFWVEITSTPVKINGEFKYYLANWVDITERKQAEEKLREAEEEKSALLEEAPIAIFNTDLKGKITYVNKRFESESGYSREEIIGKNAFKLDWFSEGTLRHFMQRMAARLRGKPHKNWATQFKCKDGRWIWIETEGKVLRKSGVLVGFQIVARNITERKQAEEEIARLAKFPSENPNPIMRVAQDGTIFYANKAALPLLNEWKCQVGQPLPEYWREFILGVLHSGSRKDVEINVGKQTISVTFSPVAGKDYVNLYGLDITERKQAEQALADEATRRHILIDQSLDGIVVLGENAKVYEANQKFAEMLGYTPEEIRELHVWDWEYLYPRERVLEMIRTVDEAGDHFETQHRRKDGSVYDVEISTNGAVVAGQKLIFCVCRDITERKKAEEELRWAKEQFQALVEESPLGVSMLKQDGRYQYVNPKFVEMFGYTLEDLPTGREWFTKAYPDPEYRSKVISTWQTDAKLSKRGEVKPQTYTVTCKDGSEKITQFRPVALETGDYFVIYEDITERKQAEEALQAEKNKLQSLINAMEDGLSIQDKDYNIIYQNKPSRISSGGDRTGEKCYRAYENREKVCDGCPVEKAYKDGKSHTSERKWVMPSGEVIFWETTANPIRDAGGNIVSCLEVARNITERKNMEKRLQTKNEQLDAQNEELKAINEELQATEEELQQSQEKLERMFKSVTDGIVVASPDGTILKVNEKAVQMHGFASEDEMLGKNALELSAPRDHEKITQNMRRALKEGTTTSQEYSLLRADGSEFPGELSTSALKDASGKVMGHITIARDITERKQTEELLRTVAYSSPVGIYIVQDRKFQRTNPQFQKLTGYTKDELTGMDSLALVLPEERDEVRKKAVKMLKGKRSSPYQFRVVNKAGETRWVMGTVTSILYRGRRAILGNYMDITERRQAEEREDQLEQELNLAGRLASIGQLAAGVAHEINNPLTGVIGFSHLMLSRDIPDDMKQDLQVIHSEAQRVAKIVENLLVFAHQPKTGREYVVINDIITRVLELRAYEMKVNNIEVENQLDPDLPLTMADAGQLQQVFLNIVLNAEHFITKAHNKGKLLVKTEKVNGNIRASFTDDGAGISPENLDKIFNPFFTTKEVGKGTGLGLSICHGIITQHQGRIYAQSELGKGATFVIELPIVAEPVQAGKAEVTKKEPQKPRGAKILVVDDEAAILTFLSRLLTDMGHSVETINNADIALERLKTERYSLILLDIKLPGMSGIELYHHIEEIAPALTRRVMFITGDVMEGTTRSFLEKAGVPHITKPIDIEELKKMMNNALNQTQVAAKASG